jgi:hypothetical protein
VDVRRAALADLDTTSPFPYAWVLFARGVLWAEEGAWLAKPIAPPTTPPFEEPPAPEGPYILTANCRFNDRISNAHKVDELVAAKAWWTKGTCQSNR